jgi:tRNA G18 (ribose-2'-O)-methylase SpoU
VGYRFHLGVVAAAERRAWTDIESTCRMQRERNGGVTLVVCPAVNDPENLGAIARIADVFGVDGILAGPGCPDPLSRRVLRVSMGAVLRLPVWVDEQPELLLDRLHDEIGLQAAAAVTDPDATPIARFERPPSLALVLGNEAQGLSAPWIARCHHRVTIPMRPNADSLNVAVATGILLYSLSTAQSDR